MNSFVIEHACIFTLNATNEVITDGSLWVENGRIVALGSKHQIRFPDHLPRIDAQGKALLPGLVDAHCHSSLMRGINENMHLIEWLPHYQLEFRALTEEDAWHAARLTYLEALKGGTTCLMDMYRFMDRCADAARELGMRVCLAPYVADKPGKDFFATQQENIALIKTQHNSEQGRIQVWMGLEHLFYCTPEAYTTARAYALEYGVGIHTHACEQKDEEAAVLRTFGRRSIAQLDHYAVLSERTLLAHCAWLTEDEIKLLADRGTAIAHCPISNAKMASGVAPVPEMLAGGLRVGLGTDGSICNNNLDLFEEMKFASLIQKATRLDATVLPADQMLRMATIDGARALGLDDQIGSLEVNKRADMILVDVGQAHLNPQQIDNKGGNLLWNLVFAAGASDVTDVWIDGWQRVKNRQVTGVDALRVIDQAQSCAVDFYRRCAALSNKTVSFIPEGS